MHNGREMGLDLKRPGLSREIRGGLAAAPTGTS
jgi:hypothetical protein